MEKQGKALCPENEELLEFMFKKRKELLGTPKGITENVDKTLQKAYSNICHAKNPIRTLKDLSQIKGVGKWILRLLKEFFKMDSDASESEDVTEIGKKTKAPRRYVPQKNSVAYALLISLYREIAGGKEFLRKQELIDAAEASGLSRAPVGPELGKGKAARFGSSPRDWYSGWSCMKTLITKGLVAKSSCPAKYMLTEEGRQAARECLARSGLGDVSEQSTTIGKHPNMDSDNISNFQRTRVDISKELPSESFRPSLQKKSNDVFREYLDRYTRMGYSEEQIVRAFTEVSKASPDKEISSLWPAVLCRLKLEQVYGVPSTSQKNCRKKTAASMTTRKSEIGEVDVVMIDESELGSVRDYTSRSSLRPCSSSLPAESSLRACSSTYRPVDKQSSSGSETSINVLSMPPLRFGENFDEAYMVILILDDREQFTAKGSRSRKIIENISTQFKIQIDVRRLPVGDGIWVARHKQLGYEYVLDFIVERKNVDDLRSSIRDNRYKDQKLRLLRCGLKKLIYMVEGDANASEAAESIKTACFTTEILEGFDVQRTTGLGDTLRRYGYLTHAIGEYYKLQSLQDKNSLGICPSFEEFMRKCREVEKMTVSDVFGIQLMQVPQVTEEIAIAVLDLYPTVIALARAYSFLEGDVSGQEEMLKKQSNNAINSAASKNIYQLVWGS